MRLFIYCTLSLFSIILNKVDGQVQSSFIKTLESGTLPIYSGGPVVQQLSEVVSYLGGLFWSDDGAKIAYIDRYGPAIGRYTPSDGRFNRMPLAEGLETIAIFPVKGASDLRFVVGLDGRLVLIIVTGTGNDLSLNLYHLRNVAYDSDEIFQKGKTDNYGRLWYSSLKGERRPKGRLYKIENLGEPQLMEDRLISGGGMAFTSDYRHFYLVDHSVGIIYKYNFNAREGTISKRRIVFKSSEFSYLPGKPFDLAIDTNGFLWIGLLEGGAIIQYDENRGEILWQVAIPTANIVSLEFGGLDKKTLYVGTDRQHLINPSREIAGGAMFSVSGLNATGIVDNDIVVPSRYVTCNNKKTCG